MPRAKKAAAEMSVAPKVPSGPARAVLFELENLSIAGREVIYATLKRELATKGVKMAPFMFSRYCLAACLKNGIGNLLASVGKSRISKDKVFEDVRCGVKAGLLSGPVRPAPGVGKLIRRAKDEGVAVGALSCLDAESAALLISRMGLDRDVPHVLPFACEERSHPTADAWLRLARKMDLSPVSCVAVATCNISCRAAVSCGMFCAVVPDAFTAFQDFGGADFVADTLNDDTVDRIFALLDGR
jgi:beta-phosphoglucomutase-like phosphatase (HAD superfamily)